jgi:NAD(P)-dependent dehydrogenase (short-subunit alcohol dehydrogenase family)
VLITGAAGGIGTVTCRSFLDRGWDVVGVDVAPASVHHDCYTHLVCDVTDAEDLTGKVHALPGHVSHLVTMAGIALPEETHVDATGGLVDAEVFARSVALNLAGHYHALLAVVDDLAAGVGDRSVTFCSSVNAVHGFGLPAYSAAKAGLSGLAVALAAPLGSLGVRVNVVQPGTTPTPRTVEEWSHRAGHFEDMLASTALGRLASPGDVAAVFVALACDLTHVTGQTVIVDGGQVVTP